MAAPLLKSGDWLVMFLLLRFLKKIKITAKHAMRIIPPIEPTKPPINLEFLSATDPVLADTTAEVGIATTVVMVVSAFVTTDVYEEVKEVSLL